MNRVPVRRRSRSPDVSGAPLLRRRICPEPPSHAPIIADSASTASDVRGRGGLSAVEWRQLYERVLPNPFDMDEFQRVLLEGKLHDHFLAKDLHKLVMELRALLESHGELRMAEQLTVKGRKKDLAHAASAALRLLETGRPRSRVGEMCAARATSPALSSTPLFENPSVAAPTPAPGLGSSPVAAPGPSPSLPSCAPFAKIRLDPPVSQRPHPPKLSAPELPVESLEARETHETLNAMNEANSPFLRVLHVSKRAQLRFGSVPLRFDVPAQYAEAVAARRLRVQIIPLRHPATPACWPAAKDTVVYVNGQCVMTPWKRGWPDRRVEVAKSFLPLDITQYLNRNGTAQQLHINVFARDYFSQIALVVAQPRTPEDVVADIVHPLTAAPDARDTAAYDFYRHVVDDEDALAEEVVMADPVIATKCPILQTRIAVPIRGTRCRHLQCFDCQSFLLSCHKGCYWNCPLCDAELRPRDVVVDSVLWRYLLSAGETCASHLRLSRDACDSSDPSDSSALSGAAPFSWTRYTMHGDACDVVVDEEDEEDGEPEGAQSAEGKNGENGENGENGKNGEEARAGGGREGWRGAGVKEAEKALGTAACPIEL